MDNTDELIVLLFLWSVRKPGRRFKSVSSLVGIKGRKVATFEAAWEDGTRGISREVYGDGFCDALISLREGLRLAGVWEDDELSLETTVMLKHNKGGAKTLGKLEWVRKGSAWFPLLYGYELGDVTGKETQLKFWTCEQDSEFCTVDGDELKKVFAFIEAGPGAHFR